MNEEEAFSVAHTPTNDKSYILVSINEEGANVGSN